MSLVAFFIANTFSSHVHSEEVLSESKRVFGGASCTPSPACLEDPAIPTLKEYGFWVRQIRIPSNPKIDSDYEMFYAKLYAWYETEHPAHVEDFGFVQYIRGCVYSSERHADGRITTHFNVTHQNLGERALFLHPDWVVDTPFVDPLFDSNPQYPLRHYFMEWSKSPEQFPKGRGLFYGDNPPKRPRLAVSTLPMPLAHAQGLHEDFATNHSLEYRMCLYRTKDIPTRSDGTIIPGALGCFDWSSSYVYNHDAKKYESPKGMNPLCRPEKIPNLKNGW
jgi:hypothetical protein